MSKHEEPAIVGMKNDEGKQRWDLLPWESISELVAVLTFGARKYAPNNWRRVHDAQARYTAALFRHVTSWLMGERNDPESGLHHLGMRCATYRSCLRSIFQGVKYGRSIRSNGGLAQDV
jgi:hypothetical protein